VTNKEAGNKNIKR